MMQEKADQFIPKHDHLVCVDSDGSVFDTMSRKHNLCFCPLYIEHFGLQSAAEAAAWAWDTVNLRSSSRGIQRFRALLETLDLLRTSGKAARSGAVVPTLNGLRTYVENGYPLNHAGMEKYLQQHPDEEDVTKTLAWSRAVDERVAQKVHGAGPFSGAAEAVERMSAQADVVVVSVTQREALVREWSEHGMLQTASLVCGRESGSKKEIIAALHKQYAADHVLMIGDAPGDRDAAFDNGALFYPICAGQETRSWQNMGACFDAFIQGGYRNMQSELLLQFDALLPPVSSFLNAGEKTK